MWTPSSSLDHSDDKVTANLVTRVEDLHFARRQRVYDTALQAFIMSGSRGHDQSLSPTRGAVHMR
jgi:hypothetical protein